MFELKMNSWDHEVLDGHPVLDALREDCQVEEWRDRLVAYYVRSNNKICVGLWANQDSGILQRELGSWYRGEDPTPEKYDFMRYLLSYQYRKDAQVAIDEMADTAQQEAWDRVHAQQEEEERRDFWKRTHFTDVQRDNPMLDVYPVPEAI